MAAPRTKVDISAVYKALKVDGKTGAPARQFLDLIFMIEQLGDNQQIVRVRDLSDEHIGMKVTIVKSGEEAIINDIDAATSRGRSRINGSGLSFDDEEVEDVPLPVARYGSFVTLVLDSKLRRFRPDSLVILTDLRDI